MRLSSTLFGYLEHFEDYLRRRAFDLCQEESLRKTIEYSLFSGGKRFRPLIIFSIADKLSSIENVLPSALAVEYFHTSSLIADDLPCMDNDDYRRGKPSLHKQFGEMPAILTSYGLITAAFREIRQNSEKVKWGKEVLSECLEIASRCSGFEGATLGQFLDITFSSNSLKDVERVIYHKTITLFEVSFCLGWLFGGGDRAKTEKIKTLAYHFGMAFQIADDLVDFDDDLVSNSTMNIAVHFGRSLSEKKIKEHIDCFLEGLENVNLGSSGLVELAEMILQRGGILSPLCK